MKKSHFQIVNYQTNPGIKYSYSLPLPETPLMTPALVKRPLEPRIEPTILETRKLDTKYNITYHQKDEAARSVTTSPYHKRTRTRKRHFHWKITGLTACSKSCGGGNLSFALFSKLKTFKTEYIEINFKFQEFKHTSELASGT